MAGAKFERGGSEIEEQVRDIIKQHHAHLREANIGILWRTTEWVSKGEPVLGDVFQPSGRERFWAEQVEEITLDYLLILNKPKWPSLASTQRTACIDHLLMHCEQGEEKKDGTSTWKKRSHDFEGFRAEIERHGFWMPNLVKMAQVVVQRGGEVQQTLEGVAREQGVELEIAQERPAGQVIELGDEPTLADTPTGEGEPDHRHGMAAN